MDVFFGDIVKFDILNRIEPGTFKYKFLSGTDVFLRIPLIWDEHVAKTSSATAVNFHVSWQNGVIHLLIPFEKNDCLLLYPASTRGPG